MRFFNRHYFRGLAGGLAIGLFCLLFQVACLEGPTIYVGGPTQINTQTGGGGSSPAPGGQGAVVTVTIAEFGERGPAPVADNPREVRVGNTMDVTCNPRDADGKVIFDTKLTGAKPDSFVQTGGSGNGIFNQDEDNGFNGTVTAKSPGQGTLKCVVKGVASDPWQFTVVN